MAVGTAIVVASVIAATAAAGTVLLAKKPKIPSLTVKKAKAEEIATPDLVDEAALDKLARQRKTLDAKRVGRRDLRVDRNPGMATGDFTGLRVP